MPLNSDGKIKLNRLKRILDILRHENSARRVSHRANTIPLDKMELVELIRLVSNEVERLKYVDSLPLLPKR